MSLYRPSWRAEGIRLCRPLRAGRPITVSGVFPEMIAKQIPEFAKIPVAQLVGQAVDGLDGDTAALGKQVPRLERDPVRSVECNGGGLLQCS
ncbi:MAG: hypothetical protein ACT6U0_03560 [Shinella sp.]|uniref:hypothetical protein n=1 Tax=Shinella sp. TaxID=1870904 RepID=UPI004036F6FA